MRRNFVEVPEDDPMRPEVLRVPMKAGSLLIWNSQLPHGSFLDELQLTLSGNFPNSSDKFRMVQYIKMIRADEPREFLPVGHSTNFDSTELFPDDWRPSETGRKLFGIEKW